MRLFLVQFYSSSPTPAYQEIASQLRARGHCVWVGAPNRAGDLAWHDGDREVALVPGRARLPASLAQVPWLAPILKWLLSVGFFLRLRWFLRKNQPDIVHVNPGIAVWELLPILMPPTMRFVLDFRQVRQTEASGLVAKLGFRMDSWRRQFSCRYIYDTVCFLHPAGARITLGRGWAEWAVVVPLGIDPHFLEIDQAKTKPRSTGLPVRFLYLGRLTRRRQLDLILFAAREMVSVTTDFQVTFLGPDLSDGFYGKLAEDLELTSVVRIEPPVAYEDVPEVALGYDVALSYVPDDPADWRYHPTLKVLEYRALGLPIIATDFEPNRELVDDGINGLLVPNSVESLAGAMLRFVTDRDFLEQCQSWAASMRQGTTWCQVAEMYERNVYRPLLER